MRSSRPNPGALLGLAVLAGCVSMFSGLIFSPVNGDIQAGGKTLAIVAATDNDMTLAVVDSMAEAFSRNSTFKVLPAKQTAQRIPGYPQQIKGPYNAAYVTIDIDFSKTDIKKVREIMKKVGTDYAYVIWIPTGSSRTASAEGAATSGEGKQWHAVAQMFKGPEAKVVGQGRFDVTAVRYVPGAKVSAEQMREAVANTTDTVSQVIADKTGTLKK
jgi:hypothetical protein